MLNNLQLFILQEYYNQQAKVSFKMVFLLSSFKTFLQTKTSKSVNFV